ncbi:hypothetical protein [Streptomyces sp. SP17KL33]|uniref:hypothetical protein n=1 Tax=Streptomyces sp. SP17KL33 TaxID=3002534 RepID=UPI002E79D884|nr:hypothetical protein [Streptomyces sp. SP17KL33]MEE1838182.1 hypothetical protein [Streptomyces sp. SP17KL33]
MVVSTALAPAADEPVVMPTDYTEYQRMKQANPRPGACCLTADPVAHWPMFYHCGGGNGPGKRIRAHCTCDSCF